MTGFLAHVVGGAAQGFGRGMELDIKAKRDEAHAELERKWKEGENEKGRQLTRDEGAATRDLTKTENAENRRVTQEEGGATRENQRTLTGMQIGATREEGQKNRDHAIGLLKTKADIEKQMLGGQLDKAEVGADGKYVLFFKDGTIKQTEVKGQPKGESSPLEEVADPTSPTGTRMVTRQEAVGQPGKPPSGMTLTTDGKGGMTMTQGRVGAAGGMTTKTVGELEEKQLNAAEQLARLEEIKSSWDPSYQRLKPRGKAAWSSMKDFMGGDLSPEETESLTKFTQSKQVATDNLNKGIKEATGSAMGVQEAERIIAAMPNPGQGIFDGDSPTVFKAKLDKSTEQVRNALMRYSYAKYNGLDPLKTGKELHEVPALVEKRGAEIERELAEANPGATPSSLKLTLRERLRIEFGIK